MAHRSDKADSWHCPTCDARLGDLVVPLAEHDALRADIAQLGANGSREVQAHEQTKAECDTLREEAKALSNQIAVTNVELADAMRERDALRAQVEQLRRQESPVGGRFDTEPKDSPARQGDSLRAELAQERRERDTTAGMLRQARAEVERLHGSMGTLTQKLEFAQDESERLRAALTEITDLELEGDASLADAMTIADEALNPPPV